MFKSFITITLLVITFLCVDSVKARPGESTAQQKQPAASDNPQPRPTETSDAGIDQVEPDTHNSITQNKQQPAITLAEIIQISISGFVALVILWQAWIYNKQRKTMEEQTRMAAISEQAYLALRDFNVTIRNDVLLVSAVVVNGGRTPARSFQSKSQVSRVLRGQELVPFVWEKCADFKDLAFIVAGGDRNLDFVEDPGVTQEVEDALNDGEVTLFVDGECRFADFTGERQVFAFGYTVDFNYERPRAVERYQGQYPEKEKAN